ncbi:MAG TPA: DUF3565 domain-containing protein [Acidimicrobiales bacterium]|nr:DUF3565 domain-containing protein [Acidimicrobiales bacterium]
MIVGLHEDESCDWVAELSCLHNQHVRHRPPFLERPWVLSAAGRSSHIGSEIDCPLCDRAELPEGLALARTAGPFDASTLPGGLLRDHRVARGTWGELLVLEGSVRFVMAVDPPFARLVGVGDRQAIPPEVAHHLVLDGPVTLSIDFRVPADRQAGTGVVRPSRRPAARGGAPALSEETPGDRHGHREDEAENPQPPRLRDEPEGPPEAPDPT